VLHAKYDSDDSDDDVAGYPAASAYGYSDSGSDEYN